MSVWARRFSVRVRYAPSPTGFVHLGGLRTALFNYLFARRHGGEFFVRFEDTDQGRLVPWSDKDILSVLQWAGIALHEPPEYQSNRLPIYKQHAEQLLASGHAYRCFCSRERLEGLRLGNGMYPRLCLHLSPEEQSARLRGGEAHTVRLRVPSEEGPTVVEDVIRGRVSFDHRQIDDQVLMKSDGFPTYHLASVVDDHLMRVTDVIRGEEWLPSTAKHLLLYRAFGWQPPRFAHLPLLLSDQGGKLSKRHADASVKSFVEAGYQPEALVNFVAFLGWTPEGTAYDEVMTMEQLARAFSLERVHKGGASVSRRKLEFLNCEHVSRMFATAEGTAELRRRLLPFVRPLTTDGDYALQVLRVIHTRLSAMAELVAKCAYFFRDPDWTHPETVAMHAKAWREPDSSRAMAAVAEEVARVADWQPRPIGAAVATATERTGVAKGQLQQSLRFALTGTSVGASMPETMHTLGKETVVRRLAIKH